MRSGSAANPSFSCRMRTYSFVYQIKPCCQARKGASARSYGVWNQSLSRDDLLRSQWRRHLCLRAEENRFAPDVVTRCNCAPQVSHGCAGSPGPAGCTGYEHLVHRSRVPLALLAASFNPLWPMALCCNLPSRAGDPSGNAGYPAPSYPQVFHSESTLLP